MQIIPNTQYTQLDYLLAQGFIKFLQSQSSRLSAKGKELLQTVSESELTLFEILNQGSTRKKQQSWQQLERYLIDWWTKTYGGAGSALAIIKGMIKYCRYRSPYYKQLITRWLAGGELSDSENEQIGLDNWSEQLSREAFALEALSIFGKFSLLDEPLPMRSGFQVLAKPKKCKGIERSKWKNFALSRKTSFLPIASLIRKLDFFSRA